MRRAFLLSLASVLALAACEPPQPLHLGTDGKPLPKLYRIDPADTAAIQYRMLDSVNRLRAVAGIPPLTLSPLLNAAAATHSRDMSVQNRPWHFGSDGSSPLDRVRRVGYPGQMKGENISETFENEVETLSAWMAQTDTRAVIMDPSARDLGFAWYQEPSGKIWWTLLTGG
ncbi:CAP domain-containing protein [Frigidibacter sp. ROC022]|uniref:CAP domain-containing protein n=1 Tax=Frigidibacter sp. ROC022 TaxID=2971796 RepID=UPI00215A53C0|nr:CAP domain-containing protein [Frigidibacter sp. ROC022]MCR8724444.1 CAP domain-containing protein [Frigidibacter sp. ROC022]